MSGDTWFYTIDDRLYINLTDRCSLDCVFCPKTQGCFNLHQYDLHLDRLPKLDELLSVMPSLSDFSEVIFCGFGEPTLRLNILLQLAQHIKQQSDVFIRLNTDGLGSLVNKRNIVPELSQCIDAVSVSMNAQNEIIYAQHCRPAIEGSYVAMLDFLKQAKQSTLQVTATAINGLEGVDVDACHILSNQIGIKFRARELDIVG